MKKFSRCALILIIVTIISAIAGYIFENSTITPMYTSTAKLVVTPGADNEASLRAQNGALKNDFAIVFKSDVVISAAQKTAGTSEDIASYLTVKAVPDSNIIELICTNPDQSTAKTYVDAVAKNALKTTSIVPVSSIQVLEYGDESNNSFKPGLYRNTAVIAGIAAAICLFIELIVVFAIGAFKQEEDNSDDETEYERRFGKYSAKSEMDTYAQDAVNRAIMDAAVTKEVVDDAIKEVSYSDVITKEMVSDALAMQAFRSSSFRVPASSSFFILSWSPKQPGITRSFPARMQPEAVQLSSRSVVVQSVMMAPPKPHSFLATSVQRS